MGLSGGSYRAPRASGTPTVFTKPPPPHRLYTPSVAVAIPFTRHRRRLLQDERYKESTLLMQLIRHNIALWEFT